MWVRYLAGGARTSGAARGRRGPPRWRARGPPLVVTEPCATRNARMERASARRTPLAWADRCGQGLGVAGAASAQRRRIGQDVHDEQQDLIISCVRLGVLEVVAGDDQVAVARVCGAGCGYRWRDQAYPGSGQCDLPRSGATWVGVRAPGGCPRPCTPCLGAGWTGAGSCPRLRS